MPEFKNEHCSDEVASAVQGDRDTLLQLFEHHRADLHLFVNATLAGMRTLHLNDEDIVQETFVRAFREIRTLRNHSHAGFFAWLKIIASNQIRDAGRRSNAAKRGGGRIRLSVEDELFSDGILDLFCEISSSATSTPSRSAAREEAIDAVRLALANLPPEQNKAVRLHYFERLTVKETAQRMDRSPDSIRGLIQRAKQSLRSSLRKSSLWFSKKG